jgi:hypothetical protein
MTHNPWLVQYGTASLFPPKLLGTDWLLTHQKKPEIIKKMLYGYQVVMETEKKM